MNDYAKAIDVKEMGKRFKLVRQKLGMTQTKIAEELGTSQLMVFRMEKKGKRPFTVFPQYADVLLSACFSRWASFQEVRHRRREPVQQELLAQLYRQGKTVSPQGRGDGPN